MPFATRAFLERCIADVAAAYIVFNALWEPIADFVTRADHVALKELVFALHFAYDDIGPRIEALHEYHAANRFDAELAKKLRLEEQAAREDVDRLERILTALVEKLDQLGMCKLRVDVQRFRELVARERVVSLGGVNEVIARIDMALITNAD